MTLVIPGMSEEELAELSPRERWELRAQERQFLAEDKDRRNASWHRSVNTVALVLGIVVAVGTLYSGVKTLQSTQDQIRIAQEALVTDRFAKTIEALSSEDSSVRLGAVHALGRLLVDSPRDHDTITAVLVAYCLEHDLPPGKKPKPGAEPSLDLTAALTVLGHRPKRTEAKPIELFALQFHNGRLDKVDLSGAYFDGADLSNSDWYKDVIMRGTSFEHADLRDVQAHGLKDLRETSFEQARLDRAQFPGVDLRKTHMSGTNLTRTHLNDTDMREANLEDAILTETDLSHANLQGANFNRAKLTHVFLMGADLRGTGLTPEGLRSGGNVFDDDTLFGDLPAG
ncbi:hypothetical protein GCM10022221_80880 [Actinocorallia aurea]